MEVNPGYKQTEVGVIPEHWEVKPLQTLANIERGKFTARPRNDPKYYGGEIPFIQTGDVTNSSCWITTYSQTLNSEGLKVSKLFPQGTLFFTIAANIGDVAITRFATACPDSLVSITPARGIDKQWLAYELAKRKPLFENLASHNAQLNINLEKLRPYLLPVPTLAEQEAIAVALSDADALIESLEQLLTKKRQIKKGAMQELLSGQKRLPGFDGKWHIKRMGDFAPLQRGFDLPNSRLRKGAYPVVYSNGVMNYHSSYQVTGPGVVTGRSGTIGNVTFVEGNYWPHNTALWVTSFNDCNPKFIYFLYAWVGLERFTSGSGVPTLNRNDVHDFDLLIPPTKDEQTAIATILSDMDTEIAALEARLSKARQLKQGMMQELLTGRIRLL